MWFFRHVISQVALALSVIVIPGRLAGLYLIVRREQSWRTEIMFEFSNCSLSLSGHQIKLNCLLKPLLLFALFKPFTNLNLWLQIVWRRQIRLPSWNVCSLLSSSGVSTTFIKFNGASFCIQFQELFWFKFHKEELLLADIQRNIIISHYHP